MGSAGGDHPTSRAVEGLRVVEARWPDSHRCPYGVKWHSMPPPLSGPGRADPKSRLAAWQSEKQSGQAAPRSRRTAISLAYPEGPAGSAWEGPAWDRVARAAACAHPTGSKPHRSPGRAPGANVAPSASGAGKAARGKPRRTHQRRPLGFVTSVFVRLVGLDAPELLHGTEQRRLRALPGSFDS
jgi:hypothetical protein